jgi:hypothetical protein
MRNLVSIIVVAAIWGVTMRIRSRERRAGKMYPLIGTDIAVAVIVTLLIDRGNELGRSGDIAIGVGEIALITWMLFTGWKYMKPSLGVGDR